MNELVSLIVTTYNWPSALEQVLLALDKQESESFEVVIADDGSGEETRDLIARMQSSLNYPLKHVWQEDSGFRAATCRNKAVLESAGDYLVFLDGDCIVRQDFVQQHKNLQEAGWFVRGNRVKLSKSFTRRLLQPHSTQNLSSVLSILVHWLKGDIKRLFPLFKLSLGRFRYQKREEWYGVKTCNLAVARNDFYAVNGFNEDFEGWGHEDADLAIRLIRNGVLRKEGIFATTVFHCHHNEVDRSDEKRNRAMLKTSFEGAIYVKNGLLKD